MATLQGSYQGTNIYVDKTLSHEQQVAQAAAQMNTTTAPAPTPTATTAPTSNKLAPDTTESDAAKAKLDAAEAQATRDQKSIQDFLMSQQDTAEIRADAWGDIGLSPEKYFAERKAALAEIESMTTTYNNLVAAKDQQIAQSYDKLASMNFINNQIGQINRNAAPELNRISAQINAKSAVLALMNDDFQLATQLVGQAVQDSLADRQFKMEGMMMLYDMNQDVINRLDSRYQNALNRSIEMAQFEFEQAKEEKQQIGQLMLQYPTAGITMQDTMDQAFAKAQTTAGVAYNLDLYGGGSGTGTGGGGSTGGGTTTGGYKFTNTQLNKGAAGAGMSLEQFKQLDGEVQNFYINTSTTQLKEINAVLSGDPDEARKMIESSNLSPAVKAYFLSKLRASQPAVTSASENMYSNTSNFFTGVTSKLWSGIKGLFN